METELSTKLRIGKTQFKATIVEFYGIRSSIYWPKYSVRLLFTYSFFLYA